MTIKEAYDYLNSISDNWNASGDTYDPYTIPLGYGLGSREDWMRSRGMPVEEPAPPKPNTDVRIREIEKELDIIRGRVPTPKGYRINPLRIKELMQEYKQLTNT